MPKETHFYDTINATRNYDTTGGQTGYNNYHSYNVTFPLRSPLINLKSITLKSVEMPMDVTLTTIRLRNKSHTLTIKFTYNAFVNVSIIVNLQAKTHTLTTLIDDINSYISVLLSSYAGVSIVFSSMTVLTGPLCVITHNCSALEIDDTPLSNYILGYTTIRVAGTSPQSLGMLIGQSPINLNAIDTCIYIKIINLPAMNNNNIDGFTFKVPLNNIVNGTVYFNDTLDHQTLFFNNTNFVLNKFDIVVVDRLGGELTGYYNWTFSLIIDYAENNNNEQQFLNINN